MSAMHARPEQRAKTGRSWWIGLVLVLVFVFSACARKQPAEESEVEPDAEPVKLDLWAGVPPLDPLADDLIGDLVPEAGPQKPEQVSEAIELPFPPPPQPTPVDGVTRAPTGPLEVLRRGPEGESGLVEAIRVSFNHPMVPLASIEQLRAHDVPMQIEPAVEGEFRWMGTRTVAFYPSGRMPFSTHYAVTIPAGTRSTHGTELAKAERWSIETPTLALERSAPYDKAKHVALDAPVFLRFNQSVDVDKLEAALHLRAGKRDIEFELIPAQRWKAEGLESSTQAWVSGSDEAWERSRVVALRPTAKLEPDTTYKLSLPAGVYGEGPEPSAALALSFSTYPPLKLSRETCSPADCSASYGISIAANNQLRDARLADKVHVEPAVEGLEVHAYWGEISLSGKFVGGTSYTVRVDAGVEDIYGQSLAKPYEARVRLGPLERSLAVWPVAKHPAIIEANAAHTLDLKVSGLRDLELMVSSFSGDEIEAYYRSNGGVGYDATWPAGLDAPAHTKTLDLRASRMREQTVTLDLDDYLEGEDSFVYVMARSESYMSYGWEQRTAIGQIIQVTNLGLTLAADGKGGELLVSDLSTGEPVAGAELRLLNYMNGVNSWTGSSDDEGRAQPHYGPIPYPMLLVKHGSDEAFLPLDQADLAGRYVGQLFNSSRKSQVRAFMFTEREPYKPGDTVHLTGILRRETRGPEGGVELWGEGITATYEVNTPRGVEVQKGEVQVSALGTFSLDIQTDPNGDTGDYSFSMSYDPLFGSERYFSHRFAVEAYRTPEFEVEVTRKDSAPLYFGDELAAEIRGRYLFGGAMVGADLSYALSRQATDFRPPSEGLDGFHFAATPGQRWSYWGYGGYSSQELEAGERKLDERGIFELRHALAQVEPDSEPKPEPSGSPESDPKPPVPQAATFSLRATVSDANRQAVAGSGSFVVHPAAYYVGLRSERSVLRTGEVTRVEAAVVDVGGERIPDIEVKIRAVRKLTTRTPVEKDGVWTFEYKTEESETSHCTLSSERAPVSCELRVGEAGTHEIIAELVDAQGRRNRSTVEVYVHGEDAVIWDEGDKRIDLVADKRNYEPGDRAKILVRSPFDRARGFLVVEREGLAQSYPLVVEGGAAVAEVEITEAMVAGATVSAVLSTGRTQIPGAPADQDLGAPAAASGQLALAVSTDQKRVFVEVTPEASVIEPGSKLRVDLHTHGLDGEAIPAAVALFVVDEGVLSLMGYETPDPLSFFHHTRAGEVGLFADHALVLPRNVEQQPTPDESEKSRSFLPMAGDGDIPEVGEETGGMHFMRNAPTESAVEQKAKESDKKTAKKEPSAALAAPTPKPVEGLSGKLAMNQEVKLRTLFATTAYFESELETDARGRASVEIEMPENLTSFRIMAVAIDPDQADRFGSGEAVVRVRKSIMLRPSLPRFLNLGDVFEASVMVDNQSEVPQTIMVGTRGLNVLLEGAVQAEVEVPAGGSREVRFPMAADQVGIMRLQFAALANEGRDATQLDVPVQVPATRQAFADYGVTSDSVLRQIEVPKDVLPGYGGLEISMSSTALNGLEDAVEYLVNYPYECSEQTASRLLPIFALGQVLDDFPIAEVHDRARRDALAKDGIERLLQRQNWDGGFTYWADDERSESWPYVSTWVTLALVEGKRAGFEVDEAKLGDAMAYLENYVRHGIPTRWGTYYDWTTRAFALWLLSSEDRGAGLFNSVWAKRDEMPLYARAMLMSAAHRYGREAPVATILAELRAQVVEDARVVHFVESRSEAAAQGLAVLMHSNTQTDAIALMALMEIGAETGDDEIAPKVMAALMDDRDPRVGGRWSTTHANAWALLAASRYYERMESQTPNFSARIWLDELFAGEHAFVGRDMSKIQEKIPMAQLMQKSAGSVTLAKEGPGKLYYRLGLRYAPADFTMAAVDRGFTVTRRYEALPAAGEAEADPDAVVRAEDGTWTVKAGTNVDVTISLVVQDRSSFVVVDDAFPAGFEGQNARFLTSVAARDQSGLDYGYSSEQGDGHRWWYPWYSFDHKQMRDDRMLLFADWLPAGVYTYHYTARATAIGTFVLPPIRAEAMYQPERFGHGSSSLVRIVE